MTDTPEVHYRTGASLVPAIVRDPGAHLVAVITNGDQQLAEQICQLLNGPPYPASCTLEIGIRGCMCLPWPDCRSYDQGAPAEVKA